MSKGANSGGNPLGRFPANLIHDGSEEVVGLFPQTKSGGGDKRGGCQFFMGGDRRTDSTNHEPNSGSAARFFYTAKASRSEREAGIGEVEAVTGAEACSVKNSHPCVKPLALMRYLVRLVTPPDGTVLDPFAGSGTTLIAAKNHGAACIGIERDERYCQIIKRRLKGVLI